MWSCFKAKSSESPTTHKEAQQVVKEIQNAYACAVNELQLLLTCIKNDDDWKSFAGTEHHKVSLLIVPMQESLIYAC
eukprot:3477598-Amphidinium_carterae.1